jgi:hypothetical protein
MKKNIGTTDRVVRLCIAFLFFIVAFFFSGFGRWVVVLLGLFSLYEALFSWCAFYALLGKNTCPVVLEK